MYKIKLKEAGLELEIVSRKKSHYAKLQLANGQTLYDVLFKALVNQTEVDTMQLKRLFSGVSPTISQAAISYVKKKILQAAKNSNNPKLQKLRFKTPGRRIAGPARERFSHMSRFTELQNRVINKTIAEIVEAGVPCDWTFVRTKCLNALRERGLAENVFLKHDTIKARLVKIAGEKTGRFFYRRAPRKIGRTQAPKPKRRI